MLEVKPMGTTADLEALKESINSGAISTFPTSRLEQFAVALCHSQAYTLFSERQFSQICETVRLQLLRSHINDLNEKNELTQKLVVALTVASLIGTAIQMFR
ncbi:MAG: hypothetical protein HP490_00660 [Nitrospira sp.]|nr:hypothetical protein [Nitrospira sp.]